MHRHVSPDRDQTAERVQASNQKIVPEEKGLDRGRGSRRTHTKISWSIGELNGGGRSLGEKNFQELCRHTKTVEDIPVLTRNQGLSRFNVKIAAFGA